MFYTAIVLYSSCKNIYHWGMRIITDPDNNFLAETAAGTMPLHQAFNICMAKDGRSAVQLAKACNLSHPDLLGHRKHGKRYPPSLKSMMLAFNAMGYDLRLERAG